MPTWSTRNQYPRHELHIAIEHENARYMTSYIAINYVVTLIELICIFTIAS